MARQVSLVVVVHDSPEASTDDGIKGGIFSKPATQAYADGWEHVFGTKEDKTCAVIDPKSVN